MIINCPECGKEISNESKQCVHCGYPIARHLAEQKQKKEIEKREEFLRNNPNFQPKAYKVFNIIQMVSIIILVVCTLLFFIILAFSNGNAFKDDFVFFSVFLIIEIVGLIIDIIICGILKSCFKRR